MTGFDMQQLVRDIRQWGQRLGFQQLAITDLNLEEYSPHLQQWLKNNFHGQMSYMARHKELRCQPEKLLPGSIRAICVRMDYATSKQNSLAEMDRRNKAYIARYARGRDYHKLMRKRLQALARKIDEKVGPFGYRAFVDSAPVLERALAEKSGLGWIGKNTMLLNRRAGSWFFLGELFTDLPLPVDEPATAHCGSCRACLDACPTGAFVGPNELDARRCISYLTIELRGPIPEEFREPMGNRIFGCDDCNLVCPWNKFTSIAEEQDFLPRNDFDNVELISLFEWSEREFLERTAGSAIRRIGYECWLRNLAVALGNAQTGEAVIAALDRRRHDESELVREHVLWALRKHGAA
jgi:epoxyqueuosine reductase